MCTSNCLIWEQSAKTVVSSHLRHAIVCYQAGDYASAMYALRDAQIADHNLAYEDLTIELEAVIQARFDGNRSARRWPRSLNCQPGHIMTYQSGLNPVIVHAPIHPPEQLAVPANPEAPQGRVLHAVS
jgi:hypothetical protein